MDISVVTFNVRVATTDDGENNFFNRLPLIEKTIKKRNPDIIGFQEVTSEMRMAFCENLNDYYIVGGGREANRLGESACVAFNKLKFAVDDCETFWLSDNIYKPGSHYENSDQSRCPRVCTAITLTSNKTGESLRFYNLHTDHVGVKAREMASTLLLKKIRADKEKYKMPFVMTGDFNATPDSRAIQLLLSTGNSIADLTKDVGDTFHDYGRSDPFIKIDYIFASKDVKCNDAFIWDEKDGNLWLSDHYPVEARITI